MKSESQLKGQDGVCSTVKVKSDSELGYVVIDEDDFDKDKHELFEAEAPKASKGKK